MELTREHVTVASAFAEVISGLHPLAEKKSQALLQKVEPNLHVYADAMRFKQILMNLVANAIKFTPQTAGSSWSPVGWKTKSGWKCATMAQEFPPDQQQRSSKRLFA